MEIYEYIISALPWGREERGASGLDVSEAMMCWWCDDDDDGVVVDVDVDDVDVGVGVDIEDGRGVVDVVIVDNDDDDNDGADTVVEFPPTTEDAVCKIGCDADDERDVWSKLGLGGGSVWRLGSFCFESVCVWWW